MKRLCAAALSLCMLFGIAACGNKSHSPNEITGELAAAQDLHYGFKQTTATDDYGRSFDAVTDYNENVVGIFYFLWLSQAADTHNVTEYEAQGKAEQTVTGDTVPGAPSFTWWGEPMYGYYQVEDEWVVRKHVELFINAGLDFIAFDCTNNDYYQAAAQTVLDVLLEYAEAGYDVPKAMFMTNTDSTGMTENIYRAFYRRGKYDKIWFRGNGDKPWILAQYAGSNEDVKNMFYFKKAQWPNRGYDSNAFPWMSWKYPQETFTDSTQDYTIMNVSVSQHLGLQSGVNFSLSGLMAPYNRDTLSDTLKNFAETRGADYYYNANWGRGYSQTAKANKHVDADKNVNFEEQWNSVYRNEQVNLVFVTGWNEWVAQRQSKDPALGGLYGYFVDTYDKEFSRDVEMMNGGYSDNCYLQLVANIRKYKGSGFASTTYHSQASGDANLYDLASWKDMPVYSDITGETIERAHAGAGGNYYKNDTGRNDIAETRVAATDSDVWFLITTANDITQKEESDTRWMNLMVGIKGREGGWNGLHYVVNRSLNGTASSLDAIDGTKFTLAGTCTTLVQGKHMLVKIPKSALGIEGNTFTLTFKVCDNLQKDFDITDLYTNGDCAPIGRIAYTYSTKENA